MSFFKTFTLLFLIISLVEKNEIFVFAKTSHYYTILNDWHNGINYYDVLGVTRESTDKQIRSAFRKLSLQYHPDRSTEKDTVEKYISITNAQVILLDEEAKKEYNDILDHGIPAFEKYYGRYANRYTGAVNHDIRYILATLVTIITIMKYLYQQNRYHLLLRRAKSTLRYKQEVEKRLKLGITEPLEVLVENAEKPKLSSLFILQLIMLPINIVRAMYDTIVVKKFRIFKTQEELEEEHRIKLGYSIEEWEEQKRQAKERFEKLKSSNKYKKYLRYMKNK